MGPKINVLAIEAKDVVQDLARKISIKNFSGFSDCINCSMAIILSFEVRKTKLEGDVSGKISARLSCDVLYDYF